MTDLTKRLCLIGSALALVTASHMVHVSWHDALHGIGWYVAGIYAMWEMNNGAR